MSSVFIALAAFVLIALVAMIHDTNMRIGGRGVSISIWDVDTGEGINTGTLADGTGKCFYGPMSWKSMTSPTGVDFEVKVPPTGSGHPTAEVHFVVKQDGAVKEFDRILPVWSGPFAPEQKYWVSLSEHLKAVAYFGTTVNM